MIRASRLPLAVAEESVPPVPKPVDCRFIDLTGRTFARFFVVRYAGKDDRRRNSLWLCRCDCGTCRLVPTHYLTTGNSKSCGCLQKESRLFAKRTHGLTSSPEYRIWAGMKTRCYNSKRAKFRRYGGRGISVCARWLRSFEAFLEDMGSRPSPLHSIERINNDGDYDPVNCVWALPGQQMRNYSRNKFISFRGKTKCLFDWAAELGINPRTLSSKLRRGVQFEDAVKPYAKGE